MIDTVGALVHLRRPGPSDWDGVLDAWLDPARHHMPVRLQSGDPERRGWTLELQHPASAD